MKYKLIIQIEEDTREILNDFCLFLHVSESEIIEKLIQYFDENIGQLKRIMTKIRLSD